jgi:hypothetical protein
MVDRPSRTMNREPLEDAIMRNLARRQDRAVALVDRGAGEKKETGESLSRRRVKAPVAAAFAGGVGAIGALLALGAIAARVIG